MTNTLFISLLLDKLQATQQGGGAIVWETNIKQIIVGFSVFTLCGALLNSSSVQLNVTCSADSSSLAQTFTEGIYRLPTLALSIIHEHV